MYRRIGRMEWLHAIGFIGIAAILEIIKGKNNE
jgi:hypothetical protein